MYESPITLITSAMETEITNEINNQIFKAVQKIGVVVSKGELCKALEYDRHQYEKGVKDTKESIKEKMESTLYEYARRYGCKCDEAYAEAFKKILCMFNIEEDLNNE